MRYNEWIRRRTIEMLEEKAERMQEEIVWLENRVGLYGEDREHDIKMKRAMLSGLKRRIAALDGGYPP
jgi:hypothetical protein